MKSWKVILASVAVFASVSSSFAQEDTRSPAVVADRYKAVSAQLDQNGDLYLILNIESVAQQVMDAAEKLVAIAADSNPETAQAKDIVAKLNIWMRANGFYGMRAYGISGVPKGDGMHSLKVFVSRDPAASQLPLWRAIAGFQPRRVACNDFLPADTAVARTSTAEIPQMWKMLKSAVNEIAPEKEAAQFNQGIAAASATLGSDLDSLINSIGDEAFFALQLSKDKKIAIPSVGEPMSIPEISFVGGFKVNDDSIVRTLNLLVATNGMPAVKTMVSDTEMTTVFLPIPLPVKLQPTYAMHKGYLLMGSSTNILQEAISCFENKNGFTSTPEFKKAFAGLPVDKGNNGIAYMGERFSSMLMDIQMKSMNGPRSPERTADSAALKELYSLAQGQGNEQVAAVFMNLQQGLLMQANSTSSGRAAFAQMAAAPMGFLAAIAIPSFMKARTSAKNSVCIGNLRMMDSAKEQWALEMGMSNGVPAVETEVLQYLKGGQLPKCPLGGYYKLNNIGTDPECTIPGHSLQQPAHRKAY